MVLKKYQKGPSNEQKTGLNLKLKNAFLFSVLPKTPSLKMDLTPILQQN